MSAAAATGRERKARRRAGSLLPAVWWAVLGAGLMPLLWLAARTLGMFGGLGTNPVERLLHDSGTIAMIHLLIALSVTPVRRLSGVSAISRLRRMLGLLAFGYVSLHFMIWLGVDLFFDPALIVDDILNRPYVTAGFAAWLILLALAATSTDGAARRLKRNWVRLHRLVYAAGLLAVLHVVWLTRADYRDALIYSAVLGALFGLRLFWAMARPRAVRSAG